MVRGAGLEPASLAAKEPKSSAIPSKNPDLCLFCVCNSNLEKMLDAPPPTNRMRLYDLVMSLTDDEITPAITVLRAMKLNRE